METTSGKLQLTVRSKKVLARVDEIEDSFMTWDGQVRVNRRRLKVYDYVLDERQERALKEARELARKSGLPLEVTDLTRQSPLRHILRSGMSRLGRRARLRSGLDSAFAGHQEPDGIRPPVCRP